LLNTPFESNKFIKELILGHHSGKMKLFKFIKVYKRNNNGATHLCGIFKDFEKARVYYVKEDRVSQSIR